jgi:hypothetical protein
MCLAARDRNVTSAFSGGGGDSKKKHRTKKNYIAQPNRTEQLKELGNFYLLSRHFSPLLLESLYCQGLVNQTASQLEPLERATFHQDNYSISES